MNAELRVGSAAVDATAGRLFRVRLHHDLVRLSLEALI